jgi:hypothetical protein
MSKAICILFAGLAIGAMGATLLATQVQAAVDAAMIGLKLEVVPSSTGLTGAPATYKVTQRTVDYISKLLKDGKTITVNTDGTIKVNRAGAN